MVTSEENTKAVAISSNNLSKIINDRGELASDLLSLLSKVNNSENTSQLKLLKRSKSKRVNDLLKKESTSVTIITIC